MLVSIRPEYQTLPTRGSNDDHPALPHHTSTQHKRFEIRDTPNSELDSAASATDPFDITDLSRGETAREGRKARFPVRPMFAWL